MGRLIYVREVSDDNHERGEEQQLTHFRTARLSLASLVVHLLVAASMAATAVAVASVAAASVARWVALWVVAVETRSISPTWV